MPRVKPQPVILEIHEIRALAEPILAEQLSPYGYVGEVEIVEAPDFDEEPIIKMRAAVAEIVPARVSIDVGYAVKMAMEGAGDDRLVFFYTKPPMEALRADWARSRTAAE